MRRLSGIFRSRTASRGDRDRSAIVFVIKNLRCATRRDYARTTIYIVRPLAAWRVQQDIAELARKRQAGTIMIDATHLKRTHRCAF